LAEDRHERRLGQRPHIVVDQLRAHALGQAVPVLAHGLERLGRLRCLRHVEQQRDLSAGAQRQVVAQEVGIAELQREQRAARRRRPVHSG
jgi:hypothetical protein